MLAISPIDGRYWSKVSELSDYFSEYALFRYRVLVEIEYFLELCTTLPELAGFDGKKNIPVLRSIYSKQNFDLGQARLVKKEEAITNHDIKAVEYYIKKQFKSLGFEKETEFIHFGLTSQDINNTAIPLLIKDCIEMVYLPLLEKSVIAPLHAMASKWMNVPMLAHTHGQPATPTRLGKELMVFVYRLQQQVNLLKQVPHSCKFGGATGQLNAHVVSYPQIDWLQFADKFTARLGLSREQWTTQISNYDNLAAQQDALRRINVILIDMCRDIWQYISLGYFAQSIVKNEVGSSAMPHKVNPIDFENAEGNLGLANSTRDHFSLKLPISRLQRDLTDSTVLRNIGVAFGHEIVAFKSIQKGLGKLKLNEQKINHDLNVENYIVISEAIQTVLRRENYPKPYEALKDLTRTGELITKKVFDEFIDRLPHIGDEVKKELKQITPSNFIGAVPHHKL
uniref:Adenylosuccinate lyase n=1 Tax=Arcella intermedia TaxID=1963864 RepID=A0A6B2L3N4_9EUKA